MLRYFLQALCVVCLVCSCPGKDEQIKPNLNADILSEDFGTGTTLLQESSDADSGGYLSLEKWVIPMEELIGKNPYEDSQTGKDLLVAIYSNYSPTDQGDFGVSRVTELRVFPDPEESKLTLQGRPLVEMSPAAIEELFGVPISKTQGSDSNTHLSFLITTGEKDGITFRLVTSHLGNGRCFAASLAIEPEL